MEVQIKFPFPFLQSKTLFFQVVGRMDTLVTLLQLFFWAHNIKVHWMGEKIAWRPDLIRFLWEGKTWALHLLVGNHRIFCPHIFTTSCSLRVTFSVSFVSFSFFLSSTCSFSKRNKECLAWLGPAEKEMWVWGSSCKGGTNVSDKCRIPAECWKERCFSFKGTGSSHSFLCLCFVCGWWALLGCWGWLGCEDPIHSSWGWSKLRKTMVLPMHTPMLEDCRHCQTRAVWAGEPMSALQWALEWARSEVKPAFLEFVLWKAVKIRHGILDWYCFLFFHFVTVSNSNNNVAVCYLQTGMRETIYLWLGNEVSEETIKGGISRT